MSILNRLRHPLPELLCEPPSPRRTKSQPRHLQLRHDAGALKIEPQRLILVEEPMARDFLLECSLPIIQNLTVHESVPADSAHGKCRRTGKSMTTLPAQSARADLTAAHAMNAAFTKVTPVANAAQFRKIDD
jgi:hypothetical protein